MKLEFVKLGEICSIQAGGTPNRSCQEYWTNGDVPWVKIGDLSGKFVTKTEECITHCGLTHSSAKLFPPGTILYSIFATLGAVSILKIEAATNQAIAGLQIKSEKIDRDYLFYYLSSLRNKVESSGRGGAQSNLNLAFLKEILVPSPSLPEQRHIADILDKIDTLIANYRRQLFLLDALIQSRFHELFGDVIRNDRSWPTKRMAEVVSCPAYEGEINQQDGKVWLLNLDKVEAESGKVLQKEYVPKHAIGASTVTFSADSVLYSKLRPYLNKVVEPDTSGYATSELIPLSPDTQCLHKTYLAALLRSRPFVSFISSRVAGAKMPRVQMKDFWNFPIPLPPLATQLRFVDFVASLKQSRSLFLETRLSNARMLKASLTQRYFNAEESVNE